jgi:hypothetical protein
MTIVEPSVVSYNIVDVRETHPLEAPKFSTVFAFDSWYVQCCQYYPTSFECMFEKPMYASALIWVYFNLEGSEFRICNSFKCSTTKQALIKEGEFVDLSNPDNYPCHPHAIDAMRQLYNNGSFANFFAKRFETKYCGIEQSAICYGPIFHNPDGGPICGFIEWRESGEKMKVQEIVKTRIFTKISHFGCSEKAGGKEYSHRYWAERRVCMLGKRTGTCTGCSKTIFSSSEW